MNLHILMTADEARAAWMGMVEAPMTDPAAQWALAQILQSVLIDHVTNRMAHDDEYARVIGRRIVTLKQATEAQS